jgi:methylase of polypeptide subunit release factors
MSTQSNSDLQSAHHNTKSEIIVGVELHADPDFELSNELDAQAAIQKDGLKSSSSIRTTITNFRTMYGRRYHASEDTSYWLPNDDEEISRLELQHLIWKFTLNGKLHLAPIPDNVHRVVDHGTGTGQWAIDFADTYPKAEVLGTDLSPIQPKRTPPNCTFVVANIEQNWTFTETFDFIHSRFLALGRICNLSVRKH